MKIGIYNPYYNSLGGGERYVVTLAAHWSASHDVDIFWDHPSILDEAEKRFALSLDRVHVVPNIFHSRNWLRKFIVSRSYDVIFFLSDGSVPFSLAKHNILHFQVPFSKVSMPVWKAVRYQAVVCNSRFTKQNLDKHIKTPAVVIYPPVDPISESARKKTRTILSVGRFSGLYGAKKYDILLDAFRKIHKQKKFHTWKYIIAGGLLKSDIGYFNELKLKAKGLPVEFYSNCPLHKLTSLYADASFYWHAAGYGETEPAHMEHFGISTVEAMSTGCIPLVFAGGGQKEIIEDGKNGFLWKTTDELIKKTISLIRGAGSIDTLRRSVEIRAKDFSQSRFTKAFDALLTKICKND